MKPTIGQQSLARLHRMGAAMVKAHHLIGDDTTDECMHEIPADKTRIFNVSARLSESADAVDNTEAQLAADIIDAERARLGLDGQG